MPRQRFITEQIINKLRQAEVLLSHGRSIREVAKKLAISDHTYYHWRRDYHEFRPHSSLGNKIPSEFAMDQGILNPAC